MLVMFLMEIIFFVAIKYFAYAALNSLILLC